MASISVLVNDILLKSLMTVGCIDQTIIRVLYLYIFHAYCVLNNRFLKCRLVAWEPIHMTTNLALRPTVDHVESHKECSGQDKRSTTMIRIHSARLTSVRFELERLPR